MSRNSSPVPSAISRKGTPTSSARGGRRGTGTPKPPGSSAGPPAILGAPSGPGAGAAGGGGATGAGTPTGSRPASRPVSPRPPIASSTPPPPSSAVHTLSTLLNLPLRLTLISNGPAFPERTVEGTLWAYEPSLSLVVLSTPSASSPQRRSYTFFKTPQIKSVVVLSTTPDAAVAVSLSEAFRSVSVKDAEQRVERAVAEDRKMRARVGKDVSEEAQRLFDALAKTLPVRWDGSRIVVMDEVLITAPYGVENVKGAKGAGERVERVRKVLEGERQRLRASAGAL